MDKCWGDRPLPRHLDRRTFRPGRSPAVMTAVYRTNSVIDQSILRLLSGEHIAFRLYHLHTLRSASTN
jgi:hypothetical protein